MESERVAAEKEVQETQVRLKKLELDRLDIEAVEHELEMRKRMLHDAEKEPDDGDNVDDNIDDNMSMSVSGVPMVCDDSTLFDNHYYQHHSLEDHHWNGKASTGGGDMSETSPDHA